MNIHVPAFSRRRFLAALGKSALLAALPTPLLAEQGDVITLSILHTTDLHGHILPTFDYNDHPDLGGLARCATQIRGWQKANPNHVLVDIGDIYQGTEIGFGTHGAAIVRCFNALGYHGWVIGNHEFDGGMETLAACAQASLMPVLSGNARVEGQPTGAMNDASHPLAHVKPYFFKEVAGFRLAFIGLTTPGLSAWIPPENRTGFEVLEPVESLRRLLTEVTVQKPDAIILTGHMGLTREDDFANKVGTLTREFPQLAVFIGGHTHQNHPSEMVNNVLYTQADHFGIYVGKVDLTFDRTSRKLLRREAITVQMDHTVALDPGVLALVRHDLDIGDQLLAKPVGELTETFNVATRFGQPSDMERLIGSGIVAALAKRGVQVDAVAHGLFDAKHASLPGTKTVADIWTILPFENEIVTLELSRADFIALANDFNAGKDFRNVMGVKLVAGPDPARFTVTDIRAADGSPLPNKPTYRIAMNTFDSQSGGERFLVVGKLTALVSNHRALHRVTTRDALTDFFLTRQRVSKASLLV